MAIACLSEETAITPREKEARLRQGSLHVGWGITPGLPQKTAKEKGHAKSKASALSCASSSHDGEDWRSHSIQSSTIEDSAEQLKKIHPKDKLFKVGIKSLKEYVQERQEGRKRRARYATREREYTNARYQDLIPSSIATSLRRGGSYSPRSRHTVSLCVYFWGEIQSGDRV